MLLAVCGATAGWSQAAERVPTHTAEGFAVPQPGARLEFPRDHGAHPEFRLEWWYLTGHLFAADGRRFGMQATFFRQAGPREAGGDQAGTGGVAGALFGADEIHLAHMALLDVKTGRFLHQERLNRAGWDAHAAVGTLDVRNGPWSLRFVEAARETMELRGGVRAEATWRLTLTPAKPLVRFGREGVSRKGADPTAASYYLTFPRLAAEGELTIPGDAAGAKANAPREPLAVTGELWMDHEISTAQLGAGQVGWDWVSVQLRDGREIMLYRMRRRDGPADPVSTLAWVGRDGAVTHRDAGEFTWEVLSTWRSPANGAEYPARVRIGAAPPGEPAGGARELFVIEPLAPDQELGGELSGIAYWEGACRVRDAEGREVGSAYMELTGYAAPLQF